MNDVDHLRDVEQIRNLKARYLRLADSKNWTALAECFCEDVTCDFLRATTDPATGKDLLPGSDAVLVGRDKAMAIIQESLATVPSVHHACLPEIEITGPDEASGIWAMADRLYISGPDGDIVLKGYGHYHETYRRIGNQWKIKTLRLVRLKVELVR